MASADHSTSTGHNLSAAPWLDAHFEICRPEYSRLVAMTDFEPGWHILDAGCGSGSFLPLLAEQVGSLGKLTALDLAPENVAYVQARVGSEVMETSVDAVEGTILDLRFADNSFDAVWCANVLLYLNDAELSRALAEFKRVVRPGGLVAIKDFSIDISTLRPMPFGYFERLISLHLKHSEDFWHGASRTWNLRRLMTETGLEDVWQRSLLSEHRAPLSSMNHDFQGSFLAQLARGALEFNLPESERTFWERQLYPNSPDAIVNHPDYYNAEAQMLAVGHVAEKRKGVL